MIFFICIFCIFNVIVGFFPHGKFKALVRSLERLRFPFSNFGSINFVAGAFIYLIFFGHGKFADFLVKKKIHRCLFFPPYFLIRRNVSVHRNLWMC